MDRLPPQNRDAERAVLCSVMRWAEALLDVAPLLRVEDFYMDAHQKIYAAMLALADRGQPVDVVTIHTEMKLRGHVEDIGGPAYLADLWDAAPTGANAPYYARIVKEASTLRQLIHAATEILRDAYDACGPAAQILEQAESSILRIADIGTGGQAVPLGTVVNESVDRVESAAQGKVKAGGILTGWIDLDKILNGLHPGELTVVGARPSVGKSAFGLALLRHAALAGAGALFVSLEMGYAELGERLLAAQAQLDTNHLRKGRLDEAGWERLSDARVALQRPTVFIDDTPNQRMVRIAATARRLKLKHNLGLVVVDYLQLVEPEDRKAQRYEQIGAISRRLKLLARELNVPVVAMAQLNRSADDRQRPRMSDLRESGSQEQDADNVLLLHQPDDGVMEVIVAKQRNGPTGNVSLTFLKSVMRFENFALDPVHTFQGMGGY